MITLGANILSQKVQRRLGTATAELATTSERLSSGQRINKGSDDAAGLSIASSLNVNSRIYSQGVRNLSDGLSAVGIAEGAMGELTGIVTRIEELATQAANGTFSSPQRDSLQKEATALQAEWNRIVDSTSFNGSLLLTGDNTRIVLQGGKGTEGTLVLQVGEEALTGGFDNYAGGTTRESTDSSGVQGNNNSTSSSSTAISADGRFIVFTSTSSNLVAGDTNSADDIFVKDVQSGDITRVSTSSSGAQGNFSSAAASISADGRFVVFTSGATNLVAGDTNSSNDIFLKDVLSGALTRVNTDSSGAQGNSFSFDASISADNRFVVFSTAASNLVAGDTNGANDVLFRDLQSGALTRVSTDSSGGEGNGSSTAASISADGRFVAFQSSASNLVTGDTNGTNDIFLKDVQSGAITLISTNSSGVQGSSSSTNPSISADGRFVAFTSLASNLVTGDTNGSDDIFLKDLQSGAITRVSTSSSGGQGSNFSDVASISADGRFVAFRSNSSNLVAGDTNGANDIFVKDSLLGTTIRVSSASSGVQGNNTSTIPSISADGRFVSFHSSATNLVAGDTNGFQDIFLRDLRKAGVQQMAGMVVNSSASAKITLELARMYREEISTYRANLGATSSRIQTFSSTLSSARLAYQGAYSRIADADIADESSKAISLSIKQQVAASLAGQANQLPRLAVDLLRNS